MDLRIQYVEKGVYAEWHGQLSTFYKEVPKGIITRISTFKYKEITDADIG
jgi:hypothetical protein